MSANRYSLRDNTVFEGVDFARYQGEPDFDMVREAGAKFAFCKATEGTSYVDPTFLRNAAHGAHNAVLVGAYHYFRPDLSPSNQAIHFAKVAEDCTSLRPVCDFEALCAVDPLTAWLRCAEFMSATSELWKCAPILYSYPSFLDPHHALSSEGLAQYDLWIAHYTDKPEPWVPRPWKSWLIWQYDGDGGKRLPSSVDCDWNRAREIPYRTAEELLS